MEKNPKFEHFLTKFLQTKKDYWLELVIFEYYNHIEKTCEDLEALKDTEKFKALPTQLSYHFLRLLFETINDSITTDMNIQCLRTFLTVGIGSKIVLLLGDLDLKIVVNEKELVNILFRLFPSERWEEDLSTASLKEISMPQLLSIYKSVNNRPSVRKEEEPFNISNFTSEPIEDNSREHEKYQTDEFKEFNAQKITSAEVAERIIKILCKLVEAEKDWTSQINDWSSTMVCLKFTFDTLPSLYEQTLFNQSDQTVITKKLMFLMFLCINNLMRCANISVDKFIFPLFELLNTAQDHDIACGLIICLLNCYGMMCTEKSTYRLEVYKELKKNNQLILQRIKSISHYNQTLLQFLQKNLMNNIKAIKRVQQNDDRINKVARKTRERNAAHHYTGSMHCDIFERLLIDSMSHVRNFKCLISALRYFKSNEICCCNRDLETIKIFLKSSTIPSALLKFLEKKVFRVMFNTRVTCMSCSEKLESESFRTEYFGAILGEINRRDGYELHCLFQHFIALIKHMRDTFLQDFVSTVIVPTFFKEKLKFDTDADDLNAKIICSLCLQILHESSKNYGVANILLLTPNMINHLRDCTLVPVLSINSCVTFRHILDYLISNDDWENMNKIKTIIFSNIHYLITELLNIYDQLSLSKISFHKDNDGVPIAADGCCEFEILDERIVMIKENLSNLDVLFLSSVHWNILCDLIVKHHSFKSDFLANICNNFNEDILFSIGYHAINTILLKRDITLGSDRNTAISEQGTMCHNNEFSQQNVFTRCDYLTPILYSQYDINYEFIISRSYKLFEICQNFIDKLQSESPCMIYSIARDKDVRFKIACIHRDNFFPECLIKTVPYDRPNIDNGKEIYAYQHWFHQFKELSIGVFEHANLKDTITKIVNRFFHPEDELREMHRLAMIREMTSKLGVKYLCSIAKSCFEICLRVAENVKLCTKMSTAVEELKLLLLQDEWTDNKESLFTALQLLISVAEMKVKSVNQILLANSEPMPLTDAIFNDDLNMPSDKTVFGDSDDEYSDEDKRTEVYYTADENYDADEEYFSAFADEFDYSQSSHQQTVSFNTACNFRNSNEHICKLVVDVLMNLSKKYLLNRNEWDPVLLESLMRRLSAMNKHFGGSEFLIKGFLPLLLQTSDELKTLQQAILDLIGDLNTPEVLKACFAILTRENVPVELIIARIETLCHQESIPKPFVAVEYPIIMDTAEPIMTSTCDTDIHRPVQSFREIHTKNKLLTPFTEASQIIPLNILELKIWNSHGYTLSTWVELESCQHDDFSSIHFLSLGNDKLILAIYLNADGSFDFNVMKPNQNYGHKKIKLSKFMHDNVTDFVDTARDPDQSLNKENINKTNIFGIASAILKDREMPNIRTRGTAKKSFYKKSNYKDDDFNRRLETSKVSVKSKKSRITYNRWTHVCLSIRNTDSQITILLTLNGIEHESIEIPIDGMMEADVNGKLQLLFIGSQMSPNDISSINYSMNNVILFKVPLETQIIAYLYGLGPDCDSFIDCELMQCMPLRGFLDLSKLLNKTSLSGAAHDLLHKLQSQVLLTYSPGKSCYATVFVKAEYGKHTGVFTVGKIPKVTCIPSLARSVYFSGGLSSVLFLFARTVELTEDHETQASALFIFLKIAYSNNQLYAEFEQKKLFNLVAHVFKHGNCHRGPGMLKAILDVIYGGSMFLRKSKHDNNEINENSELNIRNASLLVKLLTHFNIFQTSDEMEAVNLDLFFKSIMTTVRDTHPYKNANRQCLRDHGFYEKLIKFCKIHLASTSNSMKITAPTALILVDLLKMLSKNPPTLWSLNEIQKLLMLLHHPSQSFVTHDRSKFNFILSSQKPSKHSRNQSLSSKYFSFSTKIRPADSSALPSPTSSVGYSSEPIRSPQFQFNPEHGNFYSDTEMKISKSSTLVRIVKKFRTKKLDELDENQIEMITKVMRTEKKKDRTPRKGNPKRLQSTPKKKNPLRKPLLSSTVRKNTESIEELDTELITAFEHLMSSSHLNSTEIINDNFETGISVLQEQLFIILKESIALLNDLRIQTEKPECFKIESLIMFANNQDPNVRAAIISLIHVVISRQSSDVVNSYQKSNYWIHLGNQLSISPVNMKMAQACIDWICADKIVLTAVPETKKVEYRSSSETSRVDVLYRCDLSRIDFNYRPAMRVLTAMLPSMTHDVYLLKCTVNFLRILFESSQDDFQYVMDQGLLSALIKTFMKLNDKSSAEIVYEILEHLAFRSFKSMGFMHIIWDILYGLSYAERQTKSELIKDAHLKLLMQLLMSCLIENNKRGSRGSETKPLFAVTKKLGNLSSSEIKTRFNLLLDRTIQYVLSWENVTDLSQSEVDFVKYLIDLHFCGINQGSPIALWSLYPKCCEDVKQFTAHKLIATLLMDSSFSMSDVKIFKTLLNHFVSTSSSSFSEDQLRILSKFCGASLSQQQQNWNWGNNAIEKVEIIKQNAIKEHSHQVDKTIHKMESLVQSCIDFAMRMTRDVIDIQNKERRQLMNQLKKSQEIDFYHEWYELIQRMTHESAPWYNEDLYPTTFELDETEGPAGMKIRLKRAVLKIEERFFNDEFKYKARFQKKKQLLEYLLHPKETERYSISDQIIFTFNAKHLTMEQEIEGEIIITDSQLIFLTNYNTYSNSIISNILDIDEICERRYQHKEVALEIFLKSNKSYFVIFDTNYDRDIVHKFVNDKLEKKESRKIESITQDWIDQKLTNYEYLMELNKISGRSYNDLMQYPIFPWILASFDSDTLDLTNTEIFRKLFKTISTQFDDTEEHYKMNYNYLMSQMSDQQSIMRPYHYSSHYSNSGTVLHFLVRLPPFTSMFLHYQDQNFDIPDRTFHSLATTFRLTSRESTTDVKELIPEFFFLPDFLENQEGFNYGKRQSGEQVNDVKLPKWCNQSARMFILIHRQALESDFVRKNLHSWIDLIFGFKQKGKAAVDAVNVFHPATYPEFQISSITDMIERSAYETMVKTYGQMPRQIFRMAHRKSTVPSERFSDARHVLSNVKGLKWGIFAGSPNLPKPKRINLKTPITCKQKNSKLVLVKNMNMFFVVPNSCSLIRGRTTNSFDLCLWREKDGVIRTKSLNEKKSKKLFSIPTCDPVTTCGTHINYSHIWFGHQSGNISVYTRIDEYSPLKKTENTKTTNSALEDIIDIRVNRSAIDPSLNDNGVKSKWMYPIVLLRHNGEILRIKICTDFKIAVSIGVDGRTVIWDTQKIEYIRTIEPSCNTLRSQLSLVDVSPTLGDILTVFKPRQEIYEAEESDVESVEVTENACDDFVNVSMAITGKSQLRLCNINGKYIKHIFENAIVTATCFSFIKEGTGVNVIAVAFLNGSIKMYSSWNLELVREIDTACDSMIKEISFSTNHYLVTMTDQEINLWGSEGLPSERPNFHDIVFVT